MVPILAEVPKKRLGITQAVLIAKNPDFFAFGAGLIRLYSGNGLEKPPGGEERVGKRAKKIEKNRKLREQEAGSAHLVSGWRGKSN